MEELASAKGIMQFLITAALFQSFLQHLFKSRDLAQVKIIGCTS